MKNLSQTSNARHRLVLLVSIVLSLVALPMTVGAQDAQDTATNDSPRTNRTADASTSGQSSLAAQLRELQIQVAKLEESLKQKNAGGMKPGMMKQGMGMKGDKKGMAGMGKKSDAMAMSDSQEMGDKKMSGMAMMGRMKGMGKMKMSSALPGFAGASHIYHIGAASFFLDHAEHIILTQEQQVKLNQIKEKVLLGQATADRWIAQAEQELWVLTSSDRPQANQVEAKIREIEKHNSGKRIDYIRAVGQAAGVLTNEQRQSLVGNLPPEHTEAGASDQE